MFKDKKVVNELAEKNKETLANKIVKLGTGVTYEQFKQAVYLAIDKAAIKAKITV